MRLALLAVVLLFLAGLTFLTAYDVAHNGVTPLDVVSLVIIAFFGVALVGALTSRPPEDGSTQL
ncbi:MAG TPA: hypothetical protein VFN48_07230 [Solirubrobacteraceae bacterium]|nr:hypothetical protein [Solirubrobacteraceae bacterium]